MRRFPKSVRDAVIARTAGLAPDERHSIELLACAPNGVSSALLAGAGAIAGSSQKAGRHRSAGPEWTRAGVPPRDRAVRGARRGRARVGARAARGHDRRSGAHRRRRERARPPRGGRTRRRAERAVRDRRRARVRAGGRAPGGRRVLRARPFARGASPWGARADILEALSVELYLTDRLDDAIAARTQAITLRGSLSDAAAVGAGPHCDLEPGMVRGRPGDRGAAQRSRDRDPLRDRRRPAVVGLRVGQPRFLAAQRGAVSEARDVGLRAQRIADSLDGDPILHGFATIGVGVARLMEGDITARADLMAARDAGLRNATTTSPPPR